MAAAAAASSLASSSSPSGLLSCFPLVDSTPAVEGTLVFGMVDNVVFKSIGCYSNGGKI